MKALLLDNEAIQALHEPGHPKHRYVTARLTAATAGKQGEVVVLVPTAARVEAGWDRSAPAARRN